RLEAAPRPRARRHATVLSNRAQDDAVEPRSERRPPLERREPPMDDDEDLLHEIFDRRLAYPQAARAPPHEIEVLLIDLGERGDVARRRAIAGRARANGELFV